MMLLRVWHVLIYLGDGAVLIPCAALIFVWLIAASGSRRAAWWWLLAALLVSGVVALSKLLYMVSGWHPAGWNFIGLSGHTAFSFLFFPALAALVTNPDKRALRVVAVALGGCLALAIAISSWILREHSFSEVALGSLWGALVATAFLTLNWRHVPHAPSLIGWMMVSVLLLGMGAFRPEFPSASVLGWVAVQVSQRTAIHTRSDLGPQASLSRKEAVDRHVN